MPRQEHQLLLHAGDQTELERLTRSSTVPAAAAQRARIVLLAADRGADYMIAGAGPGMTRPNSRPVAGPLC